VAAVTERTKLVFLCTPNNPTGNKLDEASVRRLLGLGLPTVIDEAYHEFAENPESLSHLLSEFPNAIVLRTFSKAFGLAGLRLGYCLTHPVVTRLIGRLKLPWNVSAVTLAAAMATLDDMEEFESRRRRLIDGRNWLVRELSAVPAIEAIQSEGNFVLIDTTRVGVSAQAFVDAMLTQGVLIRSLNVHHASKAFVRVTVGDEAQNRRCVDAVRYVVMRALAEAPQREYATAASPLPS